MMHKRSCRNPRDERRTRAGRSGSIDVPSRGCVTNVRFGRGGMRMNVVFTGAWTEPWVVALVGAMLLLLGTVTRWALSSFGWGTSDHSHIPPPLPRFALARLISDGGRAVRRCRGHSALMLTRAPPGSSPPRHRSAPARAVAGARA